MDYSNFSREQKQAILVDRLKRLGIDPTKPVNQKELQAKLVDLQAQKLAQAEQPDFMEDIQGAVKGTAAGVAGLARGATIGLSDPALAGLTGIVEAGKGLVTGDERSIPEMYQSGYSGGLEDLKGLQEEYPGISTATDVTGALLPSPINVGGKLIHGAQALGRAATGARELGLASRVARGAATGAVGGAGIAGTQALSAAATGEEAPDIGTGAMIGAGIEAGLPVLGAAGRAIGRKSTKLFSDSMNRSQGFVKEFISGANEIMAARSVDQIKAKAINLFRRAQYNKLNITDELDRVLEDSVNRQTEKVRTFSGKAFNILSAGENANKTISKQGLVQPLGDALEKMSVYGGLPEFGDADKVYGELDKIYRSVKKLPGRVPLTDAKKFIMAIDNSGAVYGADPAFKNSAADKALKEIRKILNKRIRAATGGDQGSYAKFMDEYVAPAARYKNELFDLAGTPKKRISFLNKLGKEMIAGVPPGPLSNEAFLQNALLPGTSKHIAGAAKYSEVGGNQFFEDIRLFRNSVLGSVGTADRLSAKLDGLFNTFVSKAETINPIKRQLGALSAFSDDALVQMSDDFSRAVENTAMKAKFDSIGTEADSLWKSLTYGGGGFAAAYGINETTGSNVSPVTAGVAIALTTRFGPRMAKVIMLKIASSSGMPTIRSIEAMDVPRDVKDALSGGLVRFLNEAPADETPVPVTDLSTGRALNKYMTNNLDTIDRAKGLTDLHKNQQVSPEIVRRWILDGYDPQGQMKEYFKSQGVSMPGIK